MSCFLQLKMSGLDIFDNPGSIYTNRLQDCLLEELSLHYLPALLSKEPPLTPGYFRRNLAGMGGENAKIRPKRSYLTLFWRWRNFAFCASLKSTLIDSAQALFTKPVITPVLISNQTSHFSNAPLLRRQLSCFLRMTMLQARLIIIC